MPVGFSLPVFGKAAATPGGTARVHLVSLGG